MPTYRGSLLKTLLVLAAVACATISGPGPARGSNPPLTPDTVNTTAPTVPGSMTPGTTQTISGASVNDVTNSSSTLLVTLSATAGTLSIPAGNTTGLTLGTGYAGFSGATFSFQGTQTNVNAALAYLTYTAPSTAAGATISITAASLSQASGTVAYDPQVGHYFEYLASPAISWSAAQQDANGLFFDGQQGYLATIPTKATSQFIEQQLGAHNVWAGGESYDTSTQSGSAGFPSALAGASFGTGDTAASSLGRVWIWAGVQPQFTSYGGTYTLDGSYYGGPQAGQIITECTNLTGSCHYVNEDQWGGSENDAAGWVDGDTALGGNGHNGLWNGDSYPGGSGNEPNNTGFNTATADSPTNGEHYLELNASSGTNWNDLNDTSATSGSYEINGYVVEFGDQVNGSSGWTGGTMATSSVITVGGSPGQPTAVAVSAANPATGATVTWSAPTNTGSSPITGYTATAVPLVGGATLTTQCAGPPCTLTGLVSGESYSVSVTAANAAGTSSPSASVTYTVPTVPGPPTGVSVSAGSTAGGQATLSFTPPTNNGGAPITGYQVIATPVSGAPVAVTCAQSPCVVSGLSNGTSYTFTIQAVNVAGDSPAASTTATPYRVVPVPVIAPASGGIIDTSQAEPQITGTGRPGTTVTVMLAGTSLGTVTVNGAGSWTITPGSPLADGTYDLTARAADGSGHQSAISSVTQLIIDTSVPAIPAIASASPVIGASTTVSFTLTDPTPGVTLQCSFDAGDWVPCSASYSPSATGVGAHSLAVRAVNAAGTRSGEQIYTWVVAPAASTSGAGTSAGSDPAAPPRTGTTTATPPRPGHPARHPPARHPAHRPPAHRAPVRRSAASAVSVSARLTASAQHGLLVQCRLPHAEMSRCALTVRVGGRVIASGERTVSDAGHHLVTVRAMFNPAGRRLLAGARGNGLVARVTAVMTARRQTLVRAARPVSTRIYGRFRALVLDVHFATASSRLSVGAQTRIRVAARHLSDVRDVICSGATDAIGGAGYNDALGLRRARAVCGYLRALGIAAHAVARSYGKRHPAASNATPAGRAENRRVTVTVTYYDIPRRRR